MPETTSTGDAAASSEEVPATRSGTGTASDAADAIAEASFVRLSVRADGDAIAAATVLAEALADAGVGFHARFVDPLDIKTEDGRETGSIEAFPAGETADAVTIGVGLEDDPSPATAAGSGSIDLGISDRTVDGDDRRRSTSLAAFEIADRLGPDPDPVLALAGARVAGIDPDALSEGGPFDRAIEQGLADQRPGVATATDDLADGLAHSTLFHAPFSGDLAAAESLIADLGLEASVAAGENTGATTNPDEAVSRPDEEALRTLASRVAIAATGEDRSPRAAETIAASLRPYTTPSGPLATIGGLSDVLATVGVDRPDVALSFAIAPAADRDRALAAWRDHSVAAHAAIDDARTGRYDGLFVAKIATERPSIVPTVARLLRDAYSPEPVVLVLTADPIDGRRHAAMAAAEPRSIDETLAAAAAEFDGVTIGSATRARASVVDAESNFDGQLIAAIRERLT